MKILKVKNDIYKDNIYKKFRSLSFEALDQFTYNFFQTMIDVKYEVYYQIYIYEIIKTSNDYDR
jgi:hypothetical protein